MGMGVGYGHEEALASDEPCAERIASEHESFEGISADRSGCLLSPEEAQGLLFLPVDSSGNATQVPFPNAPVREAQASPTMGLDAKALEERAGRSGERGSGVDEGLDGLLAVGADVGCRVVEGARGRCIVSRRLA